MVPFISALSCHANPLHPRVEVANAAHATFEQIVKACQVAEIHDVIESLPKGYQSEIGERGVGLSGGQKQRVSIARALLKDIGVPVLPWAQACAT